MTAQEVTDLMDPSDAAGRCVVCCKCLPEALDRLRPKVCTCRMQPTVSKYLDRMIRQQQIDQYAAVVRGIPHMLIGEYLKRAFASTESSQQLQRRQGGFNNKADLAVMALLGAGDRLRNLPSRLLRKFPGPVPVRMQQVMMS